MAVNPTRAKTALEAAREGWVATVIPTAPSKSRRGRFKGNLKGVGHCSYGRIRRVRENPVYFWIQGVSHDLSERGIKMPGRVARKRIQYMRVVFNEGAQPITSFQEDVVAALNIRRSLIDRQVEVPHFGTAVIRMTRTQDNALLIDIGAGKVNEQMSTIGLNAVANVDADQSVNSPNGRAFKHSNAFCLIEQNEIVLCLDGEFRVKQVAYYLRQLLASADFTAQHQAFEIKPVTSLDQQQILAAEGVKELHFESVAFEATHRIENTNPPGMLESLKMNVRALLEVQIENDAERNTLMQNFSNLNVKAVISVKGGSRGEPVLLDALCKAGESLLDNENEQDEVWLKTNKNSVVKLGELVLGRYQNMTRREGQNDLDRHDVWNKLIEFRTGLRQNGMWAE